MLRHGDILLRSVARPDLSYSLTSSRPGERTTLATGEATGHAHVLEGLAVTHVATKKGNMGERSGLLEVMEPAFLRHEEHKTIPVPPGWYEVIRQRVYAPSAPTWVRD